MSQFDLPLPKPVSTRPEEFLVGPSNTRAVHAIEHWGAWPVMTALLTGPRKSGRSMLARLFVGVSGGTMIDDADRCAEADIFHAWNRAQGERRPLLLVAEAPPPEWAIRLPDLRSRIAASQLLTLYPPDDVLVRDLLVYLFERRGLDARLDLIAWLHRRVERTHLAVLRLVDRLEELADARPARRLSIPVVREALADSALITGLSHKQGKLAW